jgi:hypothetical protein
VGPTQHGCYKATTSFSSALPAPGVVLAMEGVDRTLVGGLKDELARLIDVGRPRMPALNGPAQMFLGGLLGIGYVYGLGSINWDFLPHGWIGDVLFALLYLAGFIGLVYAFAAGIKLFLPPLTITGAGERTQPQQWAKRVSKVVGAVAAALLPFMLEKVLG